VISNLRITVYVAKVSTRLNNFHDFIIPIFILETYQADSVEKTER
jgi:hypothetical protein